MPFLRKSVQSIAIISMMAMLFSCENDLNVVKSLDVDREKPVESMFGVNAIISDSGKNKIILVAKELHSYSKPEQSYIEMPKGVEVYFYDSLGIVSSSLKADYAISYEKKKLMEAKHHVIVTNPYGEKLLTEHLIWDQKKKTIYTDKSVQVVTKDKILVGDGFVADEKFETWEITNPNGDISTTNFTGDMK